MEINLTSALNVEEDSGKSLILKPIWLFIQEKLPLNVHYVIRNLNLPQRNIITNVLQDYHKEKKEHTYMRREMHEVCYVINVISL